MKKYYHPLGESVDNAVTAAFRTVFGWCPFRDGAKDGTVFRKGDPNWRSKTGARQSKYTIVVPDPPKAPAWVNTKY